MYCYVCWLQADSSDTYVVAHGGGVSLAGAKSSGVLFLSRGYLLACLVSKVSRFPS